MPKRAWTQAEKLDQIREWFAQHQHDYCARCEDSPPKVWAEYFRYLLDLATADPVDPAGLEAPPR